MMQCPSEMERGDKQVVVRIGFPACITYPTFKLPWEPQPVASASPNPSNSRCLLLLHKEEEEERVCGREDGHRGVDHPPPPHPPSAKLPRLFNNVTPENHQNWKYHPSCVEMHETKDLWLPIRAPMGCAPGPDRTRVPENATHTKEIPRRRRAEAARMGGGGQENSYFDFLLVSNFDSCRRRRRWCNHLQETSRPSLFNITSSNYNSKY